MGFYRKKPVVIEAVQWTGFNLIEVQKHMAPYNSILDHAANTHRKTLVIRTLEGDMEAVQGDWIIKGVQGEFYPCKPDIFEATYESAELEKMDE